MAACAACARAQTGLGAAGASHVGRARSSIRSGAGRLSETAACDHARARSRLACDRALAQAARPRHRAGAWLGDEDEQRVRLWTSAPASVSGVPASHGG